MSSKTSYPSWHSQPVEEVLKRLQSRRQGLSELEAKQRREKYGSNVIASAKQDGIAVVVLRQFKSPLIYVLLAALGISLVMGHWADAVVIGVVLVLNSVIGTFQEYRAESAIHALQQMVAAKARVLREGREEKIQRSALVPGDIVLVSGGDMVPADLRIIESQSIKAQEAVLTGESLSVAKQSEALAEEKLVPADRKNMLFMGTSISSGHGVAVVVATSESTEIGGIAKDIREAKRVKTPLQERVNRMSSWISVAILIVAGLVFAIGFFKGESLESIFLLAVALAVSAMPESLPVVMTVALAVGVRRMARRQAVLRHLPAVETLGSTSVIVSDKTGTLTQNRMTVQRIEAGGLCYAVSGLGLDRKGEIRYDDSATKIEENSPLYYTLLAATLNNEASLQKKGSHAEHADFEPQGDPMEVAFLIVAEKAGMQREKLAERYPQIGEVPFETERRFSATLHRDLASDAQELLVLIKGAPERILKMCDKQLLQAGQEKSLDYKDLLHRANQMAGEGLRVLAMAIGRGKEAAESIQQEEPQGMVFVGFQGLLDPPREEVSEAIQKCREAGIRTLMCTGDHANTAAAIAKKIGLARDEEFPQTLSGEQLDELSDEELRETLKSVSVYARVQPHQKLKIVNSLKASHQIVAVTGDGVNDAPALQSAHLGIAMGISGTDVAKEASQMVLTDDNFATIYAAVEEGRSTFRNIRMATFFLLSSAVGEVLVILISLLAGLPLPLLPVQILWLNVVTNGIEDISLAFEPGDASLYRRPPRPPEEGIMGRLIVERTWFVGIWLGLGSLGLFLWELHAQAGNLSYARTAALTTLVMFQIIHVFNCRSENISVFKKSLLQNKVLFFGALASLGVHVASLYIAPMQRLLHVEPLQGMTWLKIVSISFSIIVVVELHKWLRGRKNSL